MMINFIYFLIIFIFIFLLFITVQAIQRGLKTKSIVIEKKDLQKKNKNNNRRN